MNSEIRTYAVGSGEITLSASDAEELRIMLQREHVRNFIEGIVEKNRQDLNLPGERSRRGLVDWLTDSFDEYITLNEDYTHVTETIEDLLFSRAEGLGFIKEEKEEKTETPPPAEDEPTEECRIVGCHGDSEAIVIQRYGQNDYGAWFTDDPNDESSGSSVRGTLVDIIGEVYQCID